jgi:hypothetical protein
MNGRRLLVAGAVVLAVAIPGPARAQATVGTSFTYQGRLTDAGNPATGSYDFRFTLFDAAVGGAAVGAPVLANGVAVTQGLFASVLDFGAPAFAGQARWVQVEVRLAGGGAYTALAPRQELTPAPYSLFSSRTDPANLTILNASNLTSGTVPGARLSGTYSLALNLSNAGNTVSGTFTGNGAALTSLNASNLASGTVPSAVVSGTYSNALNLSNPANVFVGDGAGLTNLNAQPRFLRTVVVRPVGTAAQNGAALLAALAGITTASASNPWLLKIEPGVFDLGAASLVMKPFVDVEGSGEGVTKVTGLGRPTNDLATVHAVTDSEVRSLTVENRGGDAYAKALFVDGGAPRISNVTATAFGGATESQGFFVQNGATPTVLDLTARGIATGSAQSFGVINLSASPVYFDLNAFANGGTFAVAVGSYNAAAPTFRSAVAIASGATTENQGFASLASNPVMENVLGIATGAAINNLGCLNFGTPSTVVMRLATCRGIGATSINYGVLNNGGANVTIVDLVAEGVGGANARGAQNDGAGGGTTITHARVLGINGSTGSIGLYNLATPARVVDLEAYANASAAATAQAVSVSNSSPQLLHVTATAAGQAGIVVGVNNASGASSALEHVSATASGGAFAYGILNDGGPATRLVVHGGTASGLEASSFSIGVFSTGGGNSVVTDVAATASGTLGSMAGFYHDNVTVSLTNVTTNTNGGTQRIGLQNGGITAATTTVDRSTLVGSTASIFGSVASTVRVGGSKLVGPVLNSGGSTAACLFSYNGVYGALNAACQ